MIGRRSLLQRVLLPLALLALTAVALAPPAAPAAASSPDAAGPAPQLTLVRFGSPQAISDAGVFIGRARGYFREQGLDVDLVTLQSGPDAIAPMASGEVQVAGGNFNIALLNAIERGIGIKAVADKGTARPGTDFTQVPVRRDLLDSGEVRTLADLRGRRIAVASLRSGAEAIVSQMLSQAGLGVDDVELVTLGYPEMLVAFGNRAIDAGVVIEPTLSAAIGRGLIAPWEPGFTSTAFGGAYQAGILYYSGQFAGQPELARRFMTAYLRGVRVYNDAFVKGEGRAEVVRILTESTAIKDPALYDRMYMASLDPNGRLTRQSMQIELDYFRGRGYYTGGVTLDQVIDTSFAEAAAQQLGPYQ